MGVSVVFSAVILHPPISNLPCAPISNDAGESTFVKFHWRPKLGLQSTIWDETVKIPGADQDFHRRDMFDAIAA